LLYVVNYSDKNGIGHLKQYSYIVSFTRCRTRFW